MPAAFTTDAVAGNVQFGNGGPRLRDSSGVFQVRNAADTGFVRIQGATPTAAEDLTTKAYVDGLVSTPTWADALGAGPSSGANDPVINDGRSIVGDDSAAANAGSYTVRGGNFTGSGLFFAGSLTLHGGDNSSTGGPGATCTVRGGDNTVSAASGGALVCRGGMGSIGGSALFQGGDSPTGNAAGTCELAGGDNTATGRGGSTTVRGGDCIGGSGSDPGGNLTLRGGQARGSSTPGDLTIIGGQPDTGGSGSRTGHIFINTDITVSGSSRQTGAILVTTGDSSMLSLLGGSGRLEFGSGTATSGGVSGIVEIFTGDATDDTGDISILTGDSIDGDSGTITIQTGDTTSNDFNDPSGSMNFRTGDRTNTGSDSGSGTGEISMTVGTSSNPNATGGGGAWSAKAGDNDGGGPAGDASVTAGFSNAAGTPGKVSLVAQSQGTADDAHVSTDTQSGSFAGSDHRMVTKGLAVSAGAGPVTAIAIDGPTTNGQNIKVKVWATAKDDTAPGDQLSHQIEQTFFRNTTTQPMTANVNSSVAAGSWSPTTLVTLSVSVSQILVEANSLTLTASTWMFWVEWQIGGMAA